MGAGLLHNCFGNFYIGGESYYFEWIGACQVWGEIEINIKTNMGGGGKGSQMGVGGQVGGGVGQDGSRGQMGTRWEQAPDGH